MNRPQHVIHSDFPLVSVIIVYYKRRDSIEESIRSALAQDYRNIEVIVVDNHSEDGLEQVLVEHGFRVQLIQLAENRGACGGRNVAFAAARGELVVSLEDDVSFSSPYEVSRVVAVFREHPEYHVIAFQICDPDTGQLRIREWCHPRYWKDYSDCEFETHWFGEGASAFRREVFEVCGGYYEPFFYGAEGDDMVIRILNHGFRILYTPQVRVGHRASEAGRNGDRQYYYFTRNYIWTAYRNYHLWEGVQYLVVKLLMMAFFTFRSGNFRPFFRGIRDGVTGIKAIRTRAPATRETIAYLAALDARRPSIWLRLSRHRSAPQL